MADPAIVREWLAKADEKGIPVTPYLRREFR
jgi:hypothetical protein